MSSFREKYFTAPPLTILASVVIGAVLGGSGGAVIGFAVGSAAVIVIGFFVRQAQGGLLPKKVRLGLVTNVLSQQPEAVKEAFPGLQGAALHHAMDKAVEELASKALTMSPSPDEKVWFTMDALAQAVLALAATEANPARVKLYDAIWRQVVVDRVYFP